MNLKNIIIVALSISLLMPSCNIDPIDNPNGPTLESLADGATAADLLLLASGVESIMREDIGFYYNTVSIVGRDYYDLSATDPRYTGELLGAGDGAGVLDNNGFLTTRAFQVGYKVIRNAQLLSDAVDNTVATLTPEEVNGYKGFSQLVIGHELLKLLNRQYQNGARIDVADPDNLGPIVDYDTGMANVVTRLTDAANLFGSAGDALTFNLSSGFDGFSTPAGMAQVANALLARVELYRGNSSAALSALGISFFDIDGANDMGAYHAFGSSGNDRRNPLFFVPGTDTYTAHPTFLSDAEAGDNRLGKVFQIDPVSVDDLNGEYQVNVYTSDVSPIAIIRNEELKLIYAEANLGANNNEAIAAINNVRSSAGLGAYGGTDASDALLDEILHQRRYSLFAEGHRWIDMRRNGRLGEIPTDRPGDEVFDQFPTPVTEGN